MTPPDLDDLDMRLSDAIFRAEREIAGSQAADLAHRAVSLLEEQVARATSADTIETALARVGAVGAALRAGDWLRATLLADEFLEGASGQLCGELESQAAEADRGLQSVPEPDVVPVTFELSAA
jgi:hypothetical protein